MKFEEYLKDNRIWFGADGTNVPSIKRFLSEVKQGITPTTFWDYDEVGHTDGSNKALKVIFDGKQYFDYPKPVEFIKKAIEIGSNEEDLILDFFSGSGTLAESIYKINAEVEGSNRRFICVQIPEVTDEKSEAYKDGYKSICEIGKERIRRSAKKIKDDISVDNDFGLRVFRLDESNMQDVYYKPQDYKQEAMDLFADNVKHDRTADDLLAQVMLDWGLPLSLKIEQISIAGKQVFKVAENSLYACFDKGIDEAFAKAIAKDAPLRIVFRDNGFTNDTAKSNVKQLLKQLSPETEMKVL
jgi:adenine-specific DNA-methyltransferase